MEADVASSLCQTNSDEIESMWDDDTDSDFLSDPASGGTGKVIVEGAIKQVFSKFLKLFKRSRRTARNRSDKFSYASIMVATDNFSAHNKLGEGAFGPVYKGKLVTGQEVAVKSLSSTSIQGDSELKNELILRELQHRNIIQMLGFCIHGGERVLIYEHMVKGSLNCHLFGSSSDLLLNWSKRFNIIEGIAQGLVYLHKYSRRRVIHRDIKAGNILLDAQMNPKIADFGLARIFADDEETKRTNRICGTVCSGYMAPEYAMHGIYSMKTDVYSYGVLMLEIISGRKINSFYNDDRAVDLVGYAWALWKEGAGLELVDPKLEVSGKDKDQSLRCIHVGLLCTEENDDKRPTMSDVISMLTNDRVPLPELTMPAFIIDGDGAETKSINGSSILGQNADLSSINSMINYDLSGR